MIERPVYVDLLPPCNNACPAGENIQGWMAAAGAGDYYRAWCTLADHNPLPAVMGRVCYHPCESHCNRGQFDEAVNIHAVERFIGDEAIRQGWQLDPPASSTGKHLLVVGSGPAGLSAAYHLRRMGHDVTIYEAEAQAGGMMRYGIPRYRLPRNTLDAEIARIEAMGIPIKRNAKVDDLSGVMQEFDAVFLAIGAQIAKRTEIPVGDASRILDALSLLRGGETGVTSMLGRRVLVYGGGNTALDAARTAKRLGATETLIIYRRTREKMPAHEFEVEEALDEGIKFRWLSNVKAGGEETFTIEKMRLDETGFPQPTGEYETIAGDTLILALGQDVDQSLHRWTTGYPGIFAGGDMVADERTVTVAIGEGKRAARNIDAYLRGDVYRPAPKHEVATFDRLNMRHYEHAARTRQPVIEMARRVSTFDEIFAGLDAGAAAAEAHRCLSCGNCDECDNCYKICPGDAVQKLGAGKRFKFDYENCDGCGLCAEECPCGAIEMSSTGLAACG